MSAHPRFTFRDTWSLRSGTAQVYAVLAAVGDYPTWWPEVRSVSRVDEQTAGLAVRSFLPYTLNLVLTREVEDPVRGLLRVRIGGDLTGWSQWELSGDADATAAVFTQDVEVTADVLSVLALPAAALLRANHLAMMRSGARGLRRLLAGRLD